MLSLLKKTTQINLDINTKYTLIIKGAVFSVTVSKSEDHLFVRMRMILDVRARFMQPGNGVIIQSDQSSYSVRWGNMGR